MGGASTSGIRKIGRRPRRGWRGIRRGFSTTSITVLLVASGLRLLRQNSSVLDGTSVEATTEHVKGKLISDDYADRATRYVDRPIQSRIGVVKNLTLYLVIY